MKKTIKPLALKQGDLVASVSLSWGGAGLLSHRYMQGKKQFEETFGVKIVEMTNTLKSPEELYENPKLRVNDLMEAFQNPEIKGIITNIGGSETIRLLSHMTDEHFEIMRKNPKIFMGMSDTTANHFMCFKAGISSFYSSSLMFGYAENGGIPEYMIENTKKSLFSTEPIGALPEADFFITDRVEWSEMHSKIVRPRTQTTPWRYIQGEAPVQGRLLGGCTELLNMINGTPIWPKAEKWNDVILFMETSEEMPAPSYVLYLLRNLGAQGILNRLKGILFAIPGGEFSEEQSAEKEKHLQTFTEFDEVILKACKEFGREDMPVVTNMSFGHTVPQVILPIGALTEINPQAKTVSILEGAVV